MPNWKRASSTNPPSAPSKKGARQRSRSKLQWAAVALFAILALFLAWWFFFQPAAPTSSQLPQDLMIQPTDRILILAPHPDDEVLGTGGVLQDAVSKGVPIQIVFLTYGDANQWSFAVYRRIPPIPGGQVERMGEIRHKEAITADQSLGIPSSQLIFLGYPDTGTQDIFLQHWGESKPIAGLFTRATSVPYADAYRPGEPYKGESILNDLTTIIRDFQPTKIFVSHPADMNPDHRAMYLFTRVALWNLEGEIQPQVYPYLVHYPHWPARTRFAPNSTLFPPLELTVNSDWLDFPLSQQMTDKKYAALKDHKTQYESNPLVLRRFIRDNELFGDFPVVNLQPGQPVKLLSPAAQILPPSHLVNDLIQIERDVFVEIQDLSIEQQGNSLLVSIDYSAPLKPGARLVVYLDGYRNDTDFAAMPKYEIQLGSGSGLTLLNQTTPVINSEVQVQRKSAHADITVPLSELGSPDRLLISARATYEAVPLDATPWRVVMLP